VCSLEFVLGSIQVASRLPDLIQLEDGLNLIGAFRRFDQDKAKNVAA
jgi:hypothetical protein